MKEMRQKRDDFIIEEFKKLLRSGSDFSVSSMYEDIGLKVFLTEKGVKNVVNKYYKNFVTEEMKSFVKTLEPGSRDTFKNDHIEKFAEKFNVCKRESRLLIRYSKRNK